MASPEEVGYGLSLAGIDPEVVAEGLSLLGAALARRPQALLESLSELAWEETEVALGCARALLGGQPESSAAPEPTDRRFAHRAWRENPFLRGLLGSYLVGAGWWQRQAEEAELAEPDRSRARFALGMLLDALAPSNLPWANPVVLEEAVDTGGLSLCRGLYSMAQDLVRNRGQPRQVDASTFQLGVDLAATPGRVVYRNQLIELLMYEPRADRVHAQPLLLSPPWINKYYILDLAPGRSLVEFALERGFNVFAVSYRNPDASMAALTLDDYLRLGLLAALDRVLELTGSERVNLLGLCVGGTMAAITAAYLAARGGGGRIGWLTLVNTLLDFSQPGEVSVLIDEARLGRLEEKMRQKGYFEGSAMVGTFNWLRGRELVWDFVVSNWYLGRRPPAFDLMAWCTDSTNLPAAMHSQYLRACYLENLLARPGAFRIAEVPIDLTRVTLPVYLLGSESDHITPWRSTYRAVRLLGGPVRFTLSSRGHIAAVVNPPGNPKSRYWTNPRRPAEPDRWLARAAPHQGSWWEDWAAWARSRSGPRVPAPALPPGDPAPGRYVLNLTGPPLK